MVRRMTKLWVLLLALMLSVWAFGCDYTGYGAYQPPSETDGDSDGDAPDGDDTPDGDDPDGDDEPPVSGSGTCAEPFVPVAKAGSFSGSGQIEELTNSVTGAGCLEDEPAARRFAPLLARRGMNEPLDAETDGDETDGDETDGDETDGDEPEPRPTGLGPEVIVRLDLQLGDVVDISFAGDSFDAIIYVLAEQCSDTAACTWPGRGFQDEAGVGEAETLSLVSSIEGTIYVVMDSKEADASGAYDYQIAVASDSGGTPPEAGKVGAACEDKKDCDTNYCLTSAVLKALLGAEIAIPGGYCSTVDLFASTCSAPCSEANGGFCVGGGFMGPDYDIVYLCLRPCETNGDCRIEDEQVCLDPKEWVSKGWLADDVRQQYFGDRSACLPTAFIAVMEEELRGTAR